MTIIHRSWLEVREIVVSQVKGISDNIFDDRQEIGTSEWVGVAEKLAEQLMGQLCLSLSSGAPPSGIVSSDSWSHPPIRASLPLVIVGIVNMVFEFSGSPREGRMALGAPHLITAVDLEDTSVTLGARFGIFGQEFGGFDVIRITGMWFCS